ncbi:hypothetical protein V5799_022876 [Amblyomma americanum]|uniref:SLC41A/MgtE integral membrane domain-containing protein n=1 Tax=Amblyomma americanum TaxID=6943 RepID=A0AAQ4FL96_AMBAM
MRVLRSAVVAPTQEARPIPARWRVYCDSSVAVGAPAGLALKAPHFYTSRTRRKSGALEPTTGSDRTPAPGFGTHGIRGAERDGSMEAADLKADIRNGAFAKPDSKLESQRLSRDLDAGRDSGRHCHSPEATKLQAQNGHVFRNGCAVSCRDCEHTDDGRTSRKGSVAQAAEDDVHSGRVSRKGSVVCYTAEFRKGSVVCCSENGAAVTDENLNEPTDSRLKPDVSDDEESSRGSIRRKRSSASSEQSLLSIFKQAVVPFFLGGLGTVFAGLILDTVQFWPPFEHVTELFIVVPPLLGLKGNLEMTLAARLSTQANLGNMETARQVWDIALGNMALVQCQACVLSLLSSVFAIVMGLASDDAFRLDQALFVAASSVTTAAVASFLLGTVMVLVVAYSGRCRINPDNVATSVVDALGDMTTLAILAGFSTLLYRQIARPWIPSLFVAAVVVLCPVWVFVARRHPTSRKVLAVGWWPIIVAMIISSVGGYILDLAVTNFSGLAVFQPVINGERSPIASRLQLYLRLAD